MLQMSGIHKRFGELEVLKGIDFSVVKGDVLAVIGPSGSGKSTMLRCINRLEEIYAGTIEIKGRVLAKNNSEGTAEYVTEAESREILACTGMVFQQFNLFPHMTVMQ
ncbi:MAG: amino acid ABC transporter ATP-binding protein, partial [Selenomonadaceae bacterium]|nr:amino acid ABC transporter ATP-binding protein [Selenomonadaceae bacterium]